MSYPTMGTMVSSQPATAWWAGLASLGVLLLVTASAGVAADGARRMALVGAFMAVFGVVMMLLGLAMDLGASPAMETANVAGPGMLVVGILMVANGLVMLRPGRGRVMRRGP